MRPSRAIMMGIIKYLPIGIFTKYDGVINRKEFKKMWQNSMVN